MANFARLVGAADMLDAIDDLKDQVDGTATFVVGSNVEYSIFLEFGTSKMQAYPWLRPAVRELQRNPEAFIEANTNTSIDELDSVDAVVRVIALALERKMTNNVTAEGGRDRSPGTHPDHPARDTGNLAASIKAVRIS